jgi:F-type H+-transporting ATPase subunit b
MFDLLLAAEAGNPVSIELLPLITILIVFGVTFWLLKSQVWPRITSALDEREKKIREEIQQAEESREQAKAVLAEYEKSLAQAREEANQMVAKAKQDAKAVADELRSRNEGELAELKDRAMREIEAAKKAAITELHEESVVLAMSIARKILQREITTDDQRRLVEESMKELAATSRN